MIRDNYKLKEYYRIGDILCAGCGRRLRHHKIWSELRRMNLTNMLTRERATWEKIDEIQKSMNMLSPDVQFISWVSMPNDGILEGE